MGALVAGVATLWMTGLGLVAIAAPEGGPGLLWSMVSVPKFLFLTALGAILGLLVGTTAWAIARLPKVFWFLAGIPMSLRLRAARREAASAFRPGPPSARSSRISDR